MPTNFPLNIPNFEGKGSEDPSNDVMIFYLCGSSNSIIANSIQLTLFQQTNRGLSTKWYVEFPQVLVSPLHILQQPS